LPRDSAILHEYDDDDSTAMGPEEEENADEEEIDQEQGVVNMVLKGHEEVEGEGSGGGAVVDHAPSDEEDDGGDEPGRLRRVGAGTTPPTTTTTKTSSWVAAAVAAIEGATASASSSRNQHVKTKTMADPPPGSSGRTAAAAAAAATTMTMTTTIDAPWHESTMPTRASMDPTASSSSPPIIPSSSPSSPATQPAAASPTMCVATTQEGVDPPATSLSPSSPPPSEAGPPPPPSVNPSTLSEFHRIELMSQLQLQKQRKQHHAQKYQDRYKDVQGYKKLYQEYERIQNQLPSPSNITAPETTPRPTTTPTTLASADATPARHSEAVPSASKTTSSSSSSAASASIHRRAQSFDLHDSRKWFFDFQSTEFGPEVGQQQQAQPSSLSLLSASSMEAQRRLYAEKRRQRKLSNLWRRGKSKQKNKQKIHLSATTSATIPSPGAEPSTTSTMVGASIMALTSPFLPAAANDMTIGSAVKTPTTSKEDELWTTPTPNMPVSETDARRDYGPVRHRSGGGGSSVQSAPGGSPQEQSSLQLRAVSSAEPGLRIQRQQHPDRDFVTDRIGVGSVVPGDVDAYDAAECSYISDMGDTASYTSNDYRVMRRHHHHNYSNPPYYFTRGAGSGAPSSATTQNKLAELEAKVLALQRNACLAGSANALSPASSAAGDISSPPGPTGQAAISTASSADPAASGASTKLPSELGASGATVRVASLRSIFEPSSDCTAKAGAKDRSDSAAVAQDGVGPADGCHSPPSVPRSGATTTTATTATQLTSIEESIISSASSSSVSRSFAVDESASKPPKVAKEFQIAARQLGKETMNDVLVDPDVTVDVPDESIDLPPEEDGKPVEASDDSGACVESSFRVLVADCDAGKAREEKHEEEWDNDLATPAKSNVSPPMEMSLSDDEADDEGDFFDLLVREELVADKPVADNRKETEDVALMELSNTASPQALLLSSPSVPEKKVPVDPPGETMLDGTPSLEIKRRCFKAVPSLLSPIDGNVSADATPVVSPVKRIPLDSSPNGTHSPMKNRWIAELSTHQFLAMSEENALERLARLERNEAKRLEPSTYDAEEVEPEVFEEEYVAQIAIDSALTSDNGQPSIEDDPSEGYAVKNETSGNRESDDLRCTDELDPQVEHPVTSERGYGSTLSAQLESIVEMSHLSAESDALCQCKTGVSSPSIVKDSEDGSPMVQERTRSDIEADTQAGPLAIDAPSCTLVAVESPLRATQARCGADFSTPSVTQANDERSRVTMPFAREPSQVDQEQASPITDKTICHDVADLEDAGLEQEYAKIVERNERIDDVVVNAEDHDVANIAQDAGPVRQQETDAQSINSSGVDTVSKVDATEQVHRDVGNRENEEEAQTFNHSSLNSAKSSFVTAIASSQVIAEAWDDAAEEENLRKGLIKNDDEPVIELSIQPPSSVVVSSSNFEASASKGLRFVKVANEAPTDCDQPETTMTPTSHVVIDKPFATIARVSPVIQHSEPCLNRSKMPPTLCPAGEGSATSGVTEDAPEDEIHGNKSSTTRSIATATSSIFFDRTKATTEPPQESAAALTTSSFSTDRPETVSSSSWSESLALANEVERQVHEVLERYRRGGADYSADEDDAPEDELRATLTSAAVAGTTQTSAPRFAR
jgi:hypothetical protein